MDNGRFVNLSIKIPVLFLSTLFLFLLLLFAYNAYEFLHSGFLPTLSDEYAYFLDAKSFFLTGSAGAAMTLNESYSIVGGFGFHGPMYSIAYGFLFNIFGEDNMAFINILFSIFFIIFVFVLKIKLYEKLIINTLYLSFFTVWLYSFGYMVEVFHLFFAGIVSYILYKTYKKEDSGYLLAFIILILFLSLFRPSWIFYIVALLPIIKSKKEIVRYVGLLIFCSIWIMFDIKLLHASYPFGFLHGFLQNFDISQLYNHFLFNLERYFILETYSNTSFVFVFKYLFIIVLFACGYYGVFFKDRLLLSITTVSVVHLLFLFLFYDAFDWREIRANSSLFISMIFLLALRGRHRVMYFVLLVQLLGFSNMYKYYESFLGARLKTEEVNSSVVKNQIDEYRKIPELISNFNNIGDVQTILIENGLIPLDKSPLLMGLPLLDNSGRRIRYSFMLGDFHLNNSLVSNFYLSDSFVKNPMLQLLYKGDGYFLYKINRGQK